MLAVFYMKLSTLEDVTGQLCRLCQRNPPIKNSHILPEFLWKESGLAHRSDNKRCRLIYRESEQKPRFKVLNSGLTEPILCRSCETERSKFETYMSQVLYHDSCFVRKPSIGHQTIDGLDYKKVKLFTMYNLFMMGVSQHPFYERAKLGKVHTERLRACY